ncbi:MAG: hypothetical protein IJJ48_07670 [Firmicutes bacterium]|nr:hypothetical protein [Bacillota bacterium]
MKKRSYLLILFAVVLAVCILVQPALAYFTDRTHASGSIPVNFGTITRINETVVGFTKTVTIGNTGEVGKAEAVWVRARAYAGTTYPLVVTLGDGWYYRGDEDDGGDGWYYYNIPLVPGASEDPPVVGSLTTGLKVEVTGIPEADAGDHMYAQINVAVVYETTSVHYSEDGSIKPANWNIILDNGQSLPSGSGD